MGEQSNQKNLPRRSSALAAPAFKDYRTRVDDRAIHHPEPFGKWVPGVDGGRDLRRYSNRSGGSRKGLKADSILRSRWRRGARSPRVLAGATAKPRARRQLSSSNSLRSSGFFRV